MIVFINIFKFIIIILVIKYITLIPEHQDTSRFNELIVLKRRNRRGIFFPKKILELEADLKKLSIPFNIFTMGVIIGIGVIVFIIVFFITKFFFELPSIRYILSIPFLFTGVAIVKFLANKEQEKLEDGLSDFFIQLKGALKINPDIVEALRRIQNNVLEPFSKYTKQLLNEINAGKLPEIALENFSNKIGIQKFSFYINNLRYCHIYGGDIAVLTEKTHEIIDEAIKQKKKRYKETRSACIVLYILIVIDFYMYFSFISTNKYYLTLMNGTFFGQMVLNINFICVWIMIWLSRVIKKLDY